MAACPKCGGFGYLLNGTDRSDIAECGSCGAHYEFHTGKAFECLADLPDEAVDGWVLAGLPAATGHPLACLKEPPGVSRKATGVTPRAGLCRRPRGHAGPHESDNYAGCQAWIEKRYRGPPPAPFTWSD